MSDRPTFCDVKRCNMRMLTPIRVTLHTRGDSQTAFLEPKGKDQRKKAAQTGRRCGGQGTTQRADSSTHTAATPLHTMYRQASSALRKQARRVFFPFHTFSRSAPSFKAAAGGTCTTHGPLPSLRDVWRGAVFQETSQPAKIKHRNAS